jgi:hypothetical protein
MPVTTSETGNASFIHHSLIHHPKLPQAEALISSGVLPDDALFRLSVIGVAVPDTLQTDKVSSDEDTGDFLFDAIYPPSRLFRAIFEDMIANSQDQTLMRPDTRDLLFGDRLLAVFDPNADPNSHYLHTGLDQTYYCIGDLSASVMQKRALEGKTFKNENSDGVSREEEIMCKRLSFRAWKVLAKRVMPDVFNNTESFLEWEWVDRKNSGVRLEHYQKKVAGRIAVNSVVIADSEVVRLLDEAIDTGVVDLSKNSIKTLEIMLSEEHPELYSPLI